MKGKGQDGKVMINFRISKDRKRQLEYLAKVMGGNITQYLDQLILDQIRETLDKKSRDEAFEKAAVKAGVDPDIAKVMAEHRENEGLYKNILRGELYDKIMEEFTDTCYDLINSRYEEFGIPERWEGKKSSELTERMKEGI